MTAYNLLNHMPLISKLQDMLFRSDMSLKDIVSSLKSLFQERPVLAGVGMGTSVTVSMSV
jgi:hypothetical protein